MVENAREALDDRQAESKAARDPRALLQPVKFLEDFAALENGNADAGVVDADLQALAVAPAADQHAPARGIFDGVGDQVLQQPPQQQPVGFHRQRTGHEGQLQPLGPRDRREFDFQRTHQVADLETGDRRRHGAGVEPRNIQQRAEDFLDRLQRIVDVFDQPRILAAALALDQARHIEPRRIQRLQDVVARRRQKARLRDVGVLGGALGQRQFRIQPGQFLGAIAHALFQRRIGAFQRFGGLEARGDVGKGDDQRRRRASGWRAPRSPCDGPAAVPDRARLRWYRRSAAFPAARRCRRRRGDRWRP